MRAPETPLTAKAREAFAVYRDGLGRQIIDGLIAEVERLTALVVTVHELIPPKPPGDFDINADIKNQMFDELRSKLYDKPSREPWDTYKRAYSGD